MGCGRTATRGRLPGETPAALPIDDVLPAVRAALAARPELVLVAPPGAGKTTRLPLALLDEPWAQTGRLVVIEPRRLAARAAAERMAATLGEPLGRSVGLKARFERSGASGTRVEVVTEGVFVRAILDDPGLEGIAAVLFDEFHERALGAQTSASRSPSTPARCGRTCASWSCRRRSTAPASHGFSTTLR